MRYAVLLFAVMFAGCGGGSSTERETSVDDGFQTFTIAGKTMQVAKEDLPNEMTWDDAMSACQNLGNGWRLPSVQELKAMHEQLHLGDECNFKTDTAYWSSSEVSANNPWSFYFEGGRTNNDYKNNTKLVRAVRALP